MKSRYRRKLRSIYRLLPSAKPLLQHSGACCSITVTCLNSFNTGYIIISVCSKPQSSMTCYRGRAYRIQNREADAKQGQEHPEAERKTSSTGQLRQKEASTGREVSPGRRSDEARVRARRAASFHVECSISAVTRCRMGHSLRAKTQASKGLRLTAAKKYLIHKHPLRPWYDLTLIKMSLPVSSDSHSSPQRAHQE